jgi:hypothetical protein
MKVQTVLSIILVLLAASSCTIEKQLYSKGFHVEFHKRQRPADPHKPTAIQPITETPEEELRTIVSDSITDAHILQEKEVELVSVHTYEKVIPAAKPIFMKSKMKTVANKIRTGISIQTHFSESLMSKSLKKDPKKRSENKSRDFDWGEFGEWMLILGGVVGFIFLLASMPGVSFTQALVGVLIVILIIILLALLISSALDNVEWFWSGR